MRVRTNIIEQAEESTRKQEQWLWPIIFILGKQTQKRPVLKPSFIPSSEFEASLGYVRPPSLKTTNKIPNTTESSRKHRQDVGTGNE